MIFEIRNKTLFIDHEFKMDNKEIFYWKNKKEIEKIVTLTSGTDHIDLVAAKELGIEVENRPGLNAPAVAQWAVKQALDFCYAQNPPIEMKEQNTLIIGYGRIGNQIDIWLENECDFWDEKYTLSTLPKLKELLEKADFVFLCIPYNEENQDWFSPNYLDEMKQGSCIISISREGVIPPITRINARKKGITIIEDIEHVAWKTKETIEKQRKEIK